VIIYICWPYEFSIFMRSYAWGKMWYGFGQGMELCHRERYDFHPLVSHGLHTCQMRSLGSLPDSTACWCDTRHSRFCVLRRRCRVTSVHGQNYKAIKYKPESHLAVIDDVTIVPVIISIWRWCISPLNLVEYLHPILRFLHFSKFNMAAAVILDF